MDGPYDEQVRWGTPHAFLARSPARPIQFLVSFAEFGEKTVGARWAQSSEFREVSRFATAYRDVLSPVRGIWATQDVRFRCVRLEKGGDLRLRHGSGR